MFSQVLVGIDGGEGGRDALALARMLRASTGKLTLAYVSHGDEIVWHGVRPEPGAVERHALQLLEKARDQGGSYTQVRWCRSPSVGKGLHEIAESIGAELLVVGSSRRGLLGRVMLGDDTRASLNGAPCAVAIAPVAYRQHPATIHEIGVGYDGSPESEHALSVARAVAAEHGARLSACQAVHRPAFAFRGPVAVDDSCIEDMVADARKQVAELGGVEPHASYGRPGEELALYGASLDLLVIGSRSYGPVGRLVYGSTAHRLLGSARCPLLVLTRSAREADAADRSGGRREAVAPGERRAT